MANVKISLIGAGSACFSIDLIKDLCLNKNISGSTVSLMDINEERLDAVYTLCTRYIDEVGGNLRIEKTTDRAESLGGARFVVNTALAAPHIRLQEGWKIAKRYGFDYPGSFHVMYDEAFWINFYQFRLFESITEDMLNICPDAYHLMVANPVISGVTHILRKYPEARMVGLCHGPNEAYEMAERLGLARNDIHFEAPGVNHFIWMNRAKAGNRDFFEVLEERIAQVKETHEPDPLVTKIGKRKYAFYKDHGVIGIGDTMGWTGACWPWWTMERDENSNIVAKHPPEAGWQSFFTGTAANTKRLIDLSRDAAQKVTDVIPPVPSHEPMVDLIEAISCDIPKVIIVNTINSKNFVPGVPTDFSVEIPAYCTGVGIKGIETTPLGRDMIAHILRDRVAPIEMELEAFNTGSRALLEELILMDKYAASLRQVRNFLDEILELPFNREMKQHYR